MVLWDCVPSLGLSKEEPNEKTHLSSVNVSTRSKGPVIDDRLIFPKIRNIQESMKKISSNTQTPAESYLVITKDKVTAASNPMNVAENKIKKNKKGPTECDMGYDII